MTLSLKMNELIHINVQYKHQGYQNVKLVRLVMYEIPLAIQFETVTWKIREINICYWS